MKKKVVFKKSGQTEDAQGTIVEVWTTMDVKLSVDYQSVGTSIGMKAAVNAGNSPGKVLERIDRKIEVRLKKRITEMFEYLQRAADKAKAMSTR